MQGKFHSATFLLKRTKVTQADDYRHARKPSLMIFMQVLLCVTIITFSAQLLVLP